MTNELVDIDNLAQEINLSAEKVVTNLQLITNLSGNVVQISQIATDLKRDIAFMDYQLDVLIVERRCDLEKFKDLVSIVENQLQNISNRMDIITMGILTEDFSLLDVDSVKKRELLIGVLSHQGDIFNNMIIKLLSK